MVTTKIKRGEKIILQVRCKTQDVVQQAIQMFGRPLCKRQGLRGETFLLFNATVQC